VVSLFVSLRKELSKAPKMTQCLRILPNLVQFSRFAISSTNTSRLFLGALNSFVALP
jgi:hypothetical protein